MSWKVTQQELMMATSPTQLRHWRRWAGPLFVLLGVLVATLLAGLLFFSVPASAQDAGLTFTVDSTADDADAKVGTGGCATAAGACTLRAAIQEANKHSGPDTIAFNIPGEGVQTIQLTKGLPPLNTSGATTIDGYTQGDATPDGADDARENTDPLASNASIKVEIRGTGTILPADGGITALDLPSSGNTVRGLAIYDVYRSIRLQGSGSHDNHITGNFVGTNAAATVKAPTKVQFANGIHVAGGATNNNIGGASAAERNVISGNGGHGVGMYVAGTDSNKVVGNLIGLHPSGTKGWSNKAHGVDINTGASNNIVGGDSPGERNVISSSQEGVEISHGGTTNGFPTNNQVIGNFIGTDATGELVSADLANNNHGVHAQDSVRGTIIRNNVIGNSTKSGVGVGGPRTIDTKVYDNLIGISRNGAAIPNGVEGVRINSAKHSQIGPNNVITNNPVGIVVNFDDADFNTLTRNSIYGNTGLTGLGIDIQPTGKKNNNDVGDIDTKANEQLNYPVLQSATQATVSGTACAEDVVPKPCTIEVFKADGGAGVNGEGKTLVGTSTTNGDGTFTVSVTEVNVGEYVTATATDSTGNTSEFSPNRVVVSG
jgi:CSLREA domain-containing protein